jgi:exonuclease SbcD
MRFIHTADWHLGNSLFNIDRTKEFDAFLHWLKDEIIKTNADSLIIAGDVFDVANPPVISRKQYNTFLASLLGTNCRNVIIVGGNHDSGALLDSEKDILDALNIHVVGSLGNIPPEKIEDIVFEIKDKTDNVIGLCCAVPFAREIELRNYYKDKVGQGELSDCAYGALYSLVKDAAAKKATENNTSGQKTCGRKIPIIATGHLYASGLEGRLENIDTEIRCDDGRRTIDDVIGNLGSVHISVFPKEFAYVALGHIHYTTTVAKNPNVRYSGSPFVLGFDEAHLPRHVLLVDVDENGETGKETKVEAIKVPRFFNYRRISGTVAEIKNALEKYTNDKTTALADTLNLPEPVPSKEIPTIQGILDFSEPTPGTENLTDENDPIRTVKPTFLELYYKREDGVSINDELLDTIKNLPENVFVVNKKPQPSAQMNNNFYQDMDTEEIKNLAPEDIFKSLILSKSNIDKTGLSEEEVEKKQDELIKKYLPLFMEVAKEVESGESDENN